MFYVLLFFLHCPSSLPNSLKLLLLPKKDKWHLQEDEDEDESVQLRSFKRRELPEICHRALSPTTRTGVPARSPSPRGLCRGAWVSYSNSESGTTWSFKPRYSIKLMRKNTIEANKFSSKRRSWNTRIHETLLLTILSSFPLSGTLPRSHLIE